MYTVSLTVSKRTGSVILPGDTDTLTRTNYVTVYTTLACPDEIANGGFENSGG